MVLKTGTPATPDAPAVPPRGPLALAALLWREVLLPVAVVFALALIAVALIEGPPLEQFLYAVF